MSSFVDKVQPAVKEETRRLAISTSIGVVLMVLAFFVLNIFMPEKVPFDYTVILGGIAGGCVAVFNFFWMGLTVQKVVTLKNEDSAKAQMKASYTYRMLMQMLWVVIAIIAPVFQTAAGILPIFFPGIWFKILGIMQMKKQK